MPSASARPRLTRVNGIGLWNSWTRNFKTPLLALLDLLDNSVDAAFEKAQSEPEGTAPGSLGPGGSAVVTPDFSSSSSQSQSARQFHGKIHIDADTWNGRTTGLKIVNNCRTSIRDLGEIMEVYSSSKGRVEHGADHSQDGDLTFAESIGENGVGLKQGCATLSDLSFVLTRASDGKVGMAVVAQSLQSAAGVYLPHIYFNSTELQLLRNEMRNLFSSQLHNSVGECVARYGDNSLEYGIERLLRHFAHLNKKGSRGWGEESNIFCVVLHQLKHGHRVTGSRYDDIEEEVIPTLEQQYSDNAHYLMRELQDELPRNYIHVNMEVRVGGKDIHFFYWQRRLAELTTFFVKIDENHSYLEAADWYQPANGYPLRIFCGFDSVRLTSDHGVTSCSLYIYSRFSGRLIKHEEDARALLKLNAGGTVYSQGLTIVVDDMLGNLPLNPTKQDVAFGEQAHGDVHKRNLFAWLGAVVRLYYNHHLDTMCDGKKTDLTNKVKRFGTPVIDLDRLKLLNDSVFTEFRDMVWKNLRGTISCSNRKSMTINVGRDTLRRFSADPCGVRTGFEGVGVGAGGVGPETGGVWGTAGLRTGTDGLVSGGVGLGTGSVGLSTGSNWMGTRSEGLGTGRVRPGMGSAGLGTGGFQPGTSGVLEFSIGGAGLGTCGVGPVTGGVRLGTGSGGFGNTGAGPGMRNVGLGTHGARSCTGAMGIGSGGFGLGTGGVGLGTGTGVGLGTDGARPEMSRVGIGGVRPGTRGVAPGVGLGTGAARHGIGVERQGTGGVGLGTGAVGLDTGTVGLGTGGAGHGSAQIPAQKRKEAPQLRSGIDPDHTPSLSPKRQRAEANYNEDEALGVEVDVDDALPVIDLGEPDTTAESEAQEVRPVSPKSHDHSASPRGPTGLNQATESADEQVKILQVHIKGLQEQIEALRETVKKHKEKSHDRKNLVRHIDGVNKQLKKKVATLEAQLSTANGIPKSKSPRELQLEAQVDQLTDVLERRQDESDDAIKALNEKVAALKKENFHLKRERGARQDKNEDSTMKTEVTNQLVGT